MEDTQSRSEDTSIMSEFVVAEWHKQWQQVNRGYWKYLIYRLFRPVTDRLCRRCLSKEFVERIRPQFVFAARGFPMPVRHRWAIGGARMRDKTVLIQGTGSGWDAIVWAKLRPQRIIAVDKFAFSEWPEVSRFIGDKYGVPTEFHCSDLCDLSFLQDGVVDIAGSDAVFEHVKSLPETLAETNRVLKAGGVVYASYGPMWYCAGGDHFSGRGGLRNVYNHVLLDPESYKEYFRRYCNATEDYQSGGRYVELDLFSRLRTEEYLASFCAAGFEVKNIVLEVSTEALAFRRKYLDLFEEMQAKHPECCLEDFLIKGNCVRLQKAA